MLSLYRIQINNISLCQSSCQAIADIGMGETYGPTSDVKTINELIGTTNVDGMERVSKRSCFTKNVAFDKKNYKKLVKINSDKNKYYCRYVQMKHKLL